VCSSDLGQECQFREPQCESPSGQLRASAAWWSHFAIPLSKNNI
jgi:hypothetical protein